MHDKDGVLEYILVLLTVGTFNEMHLRHATNLAGAGCSALHAFCPLVGSLEGPSRRRLLPYIGF